METVNQHLLNLCHASMFVTLLYGILDCTSSSFHYVRAGHPPPILCRGKTERPRPLPMAPGQLLGMLDELIFDEQQVNLPPGGSIVLYSDGVTEATDAQDQQLGEQGLVEHLAALCGVTAQETCNIVYEAVMAHTGPFPQQDDITLICIQLLQQDNSG
ncbi:MAG: serine/threonine-protein phosphatase [Anaerolineales bacterium]|nr:serine/threonine-protein phosphatase [Anaerolineales bacterium]